MRHALHVLIVLLIPLHALAQPVPVILDTDMGNDIDDALALAMLHALESRGEAELLAVTLTIDHPAAAAYVDAVNTFYGRPNLPIGVVRDGVAAERRPMIEVPARRTHPDGSPVYPHDLQSGADAPDAVDVLRRALAAQPDGSVVVVQVGFSTNLARLLDTPGDHHSPLTGRDLVAEKVRLLSVMAGDFADDRPEYNVREDVPAAQRLFAAWPTPIVASGFEVGSALLYPATSIVNDFNYVAHHPIADAYRQYLDFPYDRPTWDLTSVLYAVRPDAGYFDLSEAGTIHVDPATALTPFTPAPDGRHRYLILDAAQKGRLVEALMLLASQPPTRSGAGE